MDDLARAAGILLFSPEGRVLLLQRSMTSDYPGTWCTPGGGIEPGESPAKAACRELLEETGYRVGSVGEPFATRISDGVHFTTFRVRCEEEFVPKLNDEHTAYCWIKPSDALAAYVPQVMAAGPVLDSPPPVPTEIDL